VLASNCASVIVTVSGGLSRCRCGGHAGQREELGAGPGVGAQRAQQGRGDRGRAEGTDSALGHAGVLGLQHHADTPGAEVGVEALGDLHGQPFLRLGLGGEVLDQAGQLGKPEDALPGQVADMRDAREEQHVMLAEGMARASTSSS